jgi:hypothetical protein
MVWSDLMAKKFYEGYPNIKAHKSYKIFKNCTLEQLKRYKKETLKDIKYADNRNDKKYFRKEYIILKCLVEEKSNNFIGVNLY